MDVFNTITEMKTFIHKAKTAGKTVGLVPTMGFFHEGHLSLMQASTEKCDITVTSIFVNPTQFGEGEDFQDYPRDLDRDLRLAEEVGVNAVFYPTPEEMYPDRFKTYVEVEEITKKMCGRTRPIHFKGVATVVTKLFNIVEPDMAFFGQKDFQQLVVIKKMAADLNMNVRVIGVPTMREKDGLAMSSRNVYLSKDERKSATCLIKALDKAEEMIASGERIPDHILCSIRKVIERAPYAKLDYAVIVDAETLEEISYIKGQVLCALAVWMGKTRLIDNRVISVDK